MHQFRVPLFSASKTASFAFLVLLSGFATAPGQTREHKPLPTEELEKYDNPPALLWRTGQSPRMVSQFNAFTSYQVNVDATGQNITGDAANEPSITVDPTNANKMAIGWRQFNSVASNFRQAGWGYTSNGGTTWTFPGVLENNVFRSDPVLDSDNTERFFYLSLLQTFFDNIWRSLDGGMSWTNLAPAKGGDKQWFTIDNTNSTGHGFQYQCWSTARKQLRRQAIHSFDRRRRHLAESGQHSQLPVLGHARRGYRLATSSSAASISAPTRSGAFARPTQRTLPPHQASIRALRLIWVATSRSANRSIRTDWSDRSFWRWIVPGTSTNNNVYMMASVVRRLTTGSDVMFVRSTNGGQTFSAPVRVNDDPVNHNKWHWFGTIVRCA